MKWIKQHWRVFVRAIGVLLILASSCIAYLWFYQIAPLRHALDPQWFRRHSAEAYWREVRTSIERIGWSHDDRVPAGLYGDADFIAWAMSQTRPDEDISGCLAGHRDEAFRLITNQDAGGNAKAWLKWWEENKSKSQAEWIRDGFAARRVAVRIPPCSADAIPLLTLLGNASSSESDQVPEFVKYNAFRWLRDSDFNPVAFAICNVTDSTDTAIKAGLLEYLRRERILPKRDQVGSLDFGERVDPYSHCDFPAIVGPRFRTTVYALIIAPLCVAIGLIVWTCRKRRAVNVQAASQAYK